MTTSPLPSMSSGRGLAGEALPALPWWRVGMVWLVIAGPLVVVVAALITAVLAVWGADPVIGGQGVSQQRGAAAGALAPAIQARNHAAKPHP